MATLRAFPAPQLGSKPPFWTRLLIFAPRPLFPETRVRRRDKDGIYSDATSEDFRVGRVYGLQPLGDRLRRAAGSRRRESDHSPVDEPGGRLGDHEHVPPEPRTKS